MSEAAQQKVRQADADLQTIIAAEPGRRFLWGVINELANVRGPSFAGEATHQAAYFEGRRSVGIDLQELCMRVAPEQYVQMVGEDVERRRMEDTAPKPEADE